MGSLAWSCSGRGRVCELRAWRPAVVWRSDQPMNEPWHNTVVLLLDHPPPLTTRNKASTVWVLNSLSLVEFTICRMRPITSIVVERSTYRPCHPQSLSRQYFLTFFLLINWMLLPASFSSNAAECTSWACPRNPRIYPKRTSIPSLRWRRPPWKRLSGRKRALVRVPVSRPLGWWRPQVGSRPTWVRPFWWGLVSVCPSP